MQMHDHSHVLITGGCGAIGSCVVKYLLRQYPATNFINLDAITYAACKDSVDPSEYKNYTLVQGNICDMPLVSNIIDTYQPSLVIHLAAETHVDQSFGNSMHFTQTNIMGTHTLLEAFRNQSCLKMFVHMSTDEVYGSVDGDESSPCHETSMFAPSNPYSATKAGAEMLCHAYHKSFKLPITIIRCNNAISPYQHSEKLVPQCVQRVLKNQKIKVHGNGSAKRTFIHATDIARAFDVIVNNTHHTYASIPTYNIGTDMEYTVMQVIAEVVKQLKPGADPMDFIEYGEDRAFQDYRYCIDSTSLRELGWSEIIPFEDAIADVIRHHTAR